ncbi:archaellar assembly protein FlaJ [Archaeoglobus profundus]|uniref:Type II secretion system protein n=1 Tax=Archaeoglobus profundus (strain DSM 5631 / JCM 9629 / NBRC 100127 / Av18) TaxID=572546 RepID=D2RE89_ARCPA|nr:archaellar assembly protein FlaJ [Archaeoglobus profundus]ADB58433.1 type II secretion system protein [Archaeoglobus profundus DSM 5631]
MSFVTKNVKLNLGFGKIFEIGFVKKVLDKLKEFRENKYMDNDLLFILTYMASLSTAQLSRDKIFEMAASTDYAPSKYFKKVVNLTKNWHYDYATACKLVAETIRHERVKKLFNRLANAIEAGEPDREVLENEWKVFKTIRKDEYQRNLESLRKWTDAYVSILVSTTLISIVVLLAVTIYSSTNPVLSLIGSAFASLAFSLFGVFMLYKSSPKDAKTHDLSIKSVEQMIIARLQKVLLPISFFVIIMFSVVPTIFNPEAKLLGIDMKGLGLVLSGIILLPLGIFGWIDDKKITKRDEAYTAFIRSVGSIVAGAGVSVAEALSRIDQKNLSELKDLVTKLYRRLSMGLDHRLSWEKFMGESGSYLIHKLTKIFVDAADMGGDTDAIGEIVSSSNLEMVLLRLKRGLIASGFVNLVIPLHISMVGLLLFITRILNRFTTLVSMMFASQMATIGSTTDVLNRVPVTGLNLGLFGSLPLELIGKYSLIISLILILANTLAMKVVKGGANYFLYFYGSILMITSGLLMIVVPPMVDWIFSIPSFLEGG